MKVLFFSQFEPHTDIGGGVERVVTELADSMIKNGIDLVVMCAGREYGYTNVRDENFKRFTFPTDVDVRMPVNSLRRKDIKRIYEFMDEFNPDIVHIHDITPTGTLLQIWAISNNKPCYHTVHILPNRAEEFGPSDFLPKIVTDRILTYYKNFYKHADRIITLTNESLVDLKDFYPVEDVIVLPNGRHLSHYGKVNYYNNDDRYNMTFIGSITPRKNQEIIIRALEFLPDNFHFNLIGIFLDKQYEKYLRSVVKNLGVEDRAHFKGFIHHDDIPPEFENTWLYVSGALLETQGLTYIESLASGTPILALENYGTKELINGKNGKLLSATATPKEFADAVLEFSKISDEEYRKLCEGSRESVADLDWDVITKETIKLYQEDIDKKKDESEEKDNEKKRFDKVRNLIKKYTPNLPMQDFIEEKVTKKVKIFNKVPKSTWIFAGLGVALSIVAYSATKAAAKIKKERK